jgi:hypothetical protein
VRENKKYLMKAMLLSSEHTSNMIRCRCKLTSEARMKSGNLLPLGIESFRIYFANKKESSFFVKNFTF